MLRALSQLGWESSRPGASRRRRTQAGSSLIEVLVAVGLAGTVIAALAAGILAMLRSSSATSSQQRLQAALTSSTESVKSLPYVACTAGAAATAGQAASPATYDATYAAWPGRWQPSAAAGVASVRITGVEYWTPASTNAALGSFLPACPAAVAGGDRGAQRLTVRVVMSDGIAKDAQVVLRRAS